MPTAVDERTRRTPEAPFRAASMGKVTWLSTSVGAMPWASVMTVTVGAVKSGNTSTGISRRGIDAQECQHERDGEDRRPVVE